MLRLLRPPPPAILVIALAVAAWIVYHLASTGTVQTLSVIVLVLPGFNLVRSFSQSRDNRQGNERG